mmetsp:Transcript_19428/g.27338  ORF Transcript_19428/g.27338 Transcript_19428/m.27338 type:complete len:213 (-) Transcript_19428:511-1149(-)
MMPTRYLMTPTSPLSKHFKQHNRTLLSQIQVYPIIPSSMPRRDFLILRDTHLIRYLEEIVVSYKDPKLIPRLLKRFVNPLKMALICPYVFSTTELMVLPSGINSSSQHLGMRLVTLQIMLECNVKCQTIMLPMSAKSKKKKTRKWKNKNSKINRNNYYTNKVDKNIVWTIMNRPSLKALLIFPPIHSKSKQTMYPKTQVHLLKPSDGKPPLC